MKMPGRLLVILASLAGILATVALLTLPLIQYCGLSFPDATIEFANYGCEQANLIASQGGRLELGTWVYLGVMTGAAAICGILAWRTHGAASTNAYLILVLGLVLTFGVVIAGFSIGLFYAPAALLILVGAIWMVVTSARGTQRALSKP